MRIKGIKKALLLMLTFVSVGGALSQTNPVDWINLKNAEVQGTTLQRVANGANRGVGYSRQVLFGREESNVFEGYAEYTADNNTDSKKLGFAIVADPTEPAGNITYGFTFRENGKVRSFGPDGGVTQNYAGTETFRLERVGNELKYLINGVETFSV